MLCRNWIRNYFHQIWCLHFRHYLYFARRI